MTGRELEKPQPPTISTLPMKAARLAFILFVLLLVNVHLSAAEPLDSISKVRALSVEDAGRRLPVRIEATVIFCNYTNDHMIIHDGKAGLYVGLGGMTLPGKEAKAGDRIRVEGVTHPGGFLPIVIEPRLEILGSGTLPKPRLLGEEEILSPQLDCEWVEVPGVITGVATEDAMLALAIEVHGWTFRALLPFDKQEQARAAGLLQRAVRLRGVAATIYNRQRQMTGRHFFVPSLAEIVPMELPAASAPVPLRAVAELLTATADSGAPVRVAGIVTHAENNVFYLRGDGGSLRVRTAQTAGLISGRLVEVEGFVAMAPFRPELRASRLAVVGRADPVQPAPLASDSDALANQPWELVIVEADVLGQRIGLGEIALQCRTGTHIFEAILPVRFPEPYKLGPGDRVRLTGICELTTTHTIPQSYWVDGFRLHLRGPEDVAIVRHAPWWKSQRIVIALGIVGAVALSALGWVALLRRQVTEQTGVIREQVRLEAAQGERQRLARELHDTVEQELSGLALQLGNARQRLAERPEQVEAALDLAQRMLRHCREEARTSIRDLRNVAIEQRGLPGALDELLPPVAAGCGAEFRCTVSGEPRSLSGTADTHFLRIAQEAVTNAAHHAAPGKISVRLDYAADAITLEIRDDGRGFDPAAPAPRGHFGLLGMHERANKLQATLTIESAVKQGTTVRVVLLVGTSSEPQTS